MPRVTIDGHSIDAPLGSTILQAAAQLGIDIPTLCHLEDCGGGGSCMVCAVGIAGSRHLVPSCATAVTDGMVIECQTPRIDEARRTALELLLSDHSGDCLAPCVNACPAHMDISAMNRHIAMGQLAEAVAIVKANIPLPATLGRICPAPCEPGCRRAAAGGPVSICQLKQHVADVDLASPSPHLPPKARPTGMRIAIVGAGPSGLSTAYFLLIAGCDVTVIDKAASPGGTLRTAITPDRLDPAILDAEIDVIARLGAHFLTSHSLGTHVTLADLRRQFDAVVIATGGVDPHLLAHMGLDSTPRGLRIDTRTFQTNLDGVFAAGGAVRPSRLAIRSVAEGKAVAHCIVSMFRGVAMERPDEIGFNVRLGKLDAAQLEPWLSGTAPLSRHEPMQPGAGLSADQARDEAMRCLHCECGAASGCRLRQASHRYGADPKRFGGPVARAVTLRVEHPHVIYEPGKCIACGLCVRIASREKAALGLSFIGRGFNIRVDAPRGARLDEALRDTAVACAKACPTGALSLR
jgi:ferredoxin